ncbi:DNA-binding response regulator, OmpR family, contains REC and winged-helix (wHTH) domain [[Clostridium] aminophilum]|uniref:Stage 0 sporulation protein A homolog n=2 Tax=[Clostridium] aminophilum TaxID=1526 RepID=A0A1I6ILP9_9FIRM|nr:DNA-binding response regulator, OmpR family, contains REC and winged-helix (wHTH) domain [[Clostridium] aminophilum]
MTTYKEAKNMSDERILVVDDEKSIRTAIRLAFKKENMTVIEAEDGDEALQILRSEHFHLVILDVMMKRVGGYQVLQTMRGNGDSTPVMMLSGKSDEMDQVLGLGFGADSYLTKPFHNSVLIQTAKALIRRSEIYSRLAPNEIRQGPFSVDTLRMTCLKNGSELALTGRELTLFRFFMEHPGQVFTKDQLYSQVWGDSIVDDNTIIVYVRRIRAKIEEDPKNPQYLKTVRGIGYLFEVSGV